MSVPWKYVIIVTMNNEYFGPNTTLDEQADKHALSALDTFAEKVDIKDTNIEDIEISNPGDEFLGGFVLPGLLDACGVSYREVFGGSIVTTTPGRAEFFESVGEMIANDLIEAYDSSAEEDEIITTEQAYCDECVRPLLEEHVSNPGPLFVVD